MTRFALLAVLVTAACASEDYDPLCPEGWEAEETGACTPPAQMYAEFPGATGVFGYVKQRSCAPHCEDIVEELPVQQRVMVFEDVLPEGCGPDDELGWNSDPTADPICREYLVTEVLTDDEGVFTVVLQPGVYLVVTATKVFGNWDGRSVTVWDGPEFVSLYFDALPV